MIRRQSAGPPAISRRESLRRMGLGTAALAVGWPGVDALAEAPGATNRPNVLFIALDDLRPMLGCYGDRQAITAHFDAFARTGCVFERAYCQAATCGASRASLLKGGSLFQVSQPPKRPRPFDQDRPIPVHTLAE